MTLPVSTTVAYAGRWPCTITQGVVLRLMLFKSCTTKLSLLCLCIFVFGFFFVFCFSCFFFVSVFQGIPVASFQHSNAVLILQLTRTQPHTACVDRSASTVMRHLVNLYPEIYKCHQHGCLSPTPQASYLSSCFCCYSYLCL